jgi:catabolite regulation protein CreA
MAAKCDRQVTANRRLERRSLVFKTLQVVHFFDKRRPRTLAHFIIRSV